MMAKYQVSVAREETEKVDTMRFAWQKLNALAVSGPGCHWYSVTCCVLISVQTKVQNHLITIQSSFKDDLLIKVVTFQADTNQFYQFYAIVSH